MEQVLKLLPQYVSSSCSTGTKFSSETNEEIDVNFAGNVTFFCTISHKHDWILDSGVTDYIAMGISLLKELRRPSSNCYFSLSNAQTVEIVGIGDIELNSGMMLKNVLCVPKFKYNLLSMSKLAKDSHISVVFNDDFCLTHDYANYLVKGIAKEAKGLDYLHNLEIFNTYYSFSLTFFWGWSGKI